MIHILNFNMSICDIGLDVSPTNRNLYLYFNFWELVSIQQLINCNRLQYIFKKINSYSGNDHNNEFTIN